MQDAEDSQREWTPQYIAKWMATPQKAVLGDLPVIVLSRAEGGYGSDLDTPPEQRDRERKEGQADLAQLSRHGKQVIVPSGHDMELEAPAEVIDAIQQVGAVVRTGGRL
jgi:hypothetical protein